MNILGDFISRVNALYPIDMDNEELNSLQTTIRNQEEELETLTKENHKLRTKLSKFEGQSIKEGVKKQKEAKKAAEKTSKKAAK
jgi:alpha-amylase